MLYVGVSKHQRPTRIFQMKYFNREPVYTTELYTAHAPMSLVPQYSSLYFGSVLKNYPSKNSKSGDGWAGIRI